MMEEIQVRVTYQGKARRPALAMRFGDRDQYFSKAHPVVVIELDGKKAYARLQPSFFVRVPQIRTIYEDPDLADRNLLVEWIAKHKVKLGDKVRLQVTERYKSFRLRI
mgnify:CR=1 FL=1